MRPPKLNLPQSNPGGHRPGLDRALRLTRRLPVDSQRELDNSWIVGLAVRWKAWEVMAFQETDQSVDRGGSSQKYIAIQLKWNWDKKPGTPEIHTRGFPGNALAQHFP